MRPTAGDPRGGVRGRGATLGLATMLPGLMLVIVIFWALAAVLMLTGTLINAREIDETVEVINGEVSSTDGIDKDLDSVKELVQTRRTVVRIRDAAEPLTGQADQIISAATSIDRSVKSILGTAGEINTTAKTINESVTSIGSSVDSIGSSVVQIHSRVGSIGSAVSSINGSVRSIFTAVGPPGATDSTSIKASVTRILRELRAVSGEVVTIDRGVAAINGRGDRAIETVRGIKSDFDGILSNVTKIDAHANSIDCATLLNIVGRTTGCNQ